MGQAAVHANDGHHGAAPRHIERLRPPGKQCDEYPFASSQEGASPATPRGPARTFPDICNGMPGATGSGVVGFSRCFIDATQNKKAGDRTRKLYREQRILVGDPFQVGSTP